MLRFVIRLVVISTLAVLAVAPMTASAAGGGGGGGNNGMTITIGSPISLQNHLLVTVPVTVSCTGSISVDPTLGQPGSIGVTVQQASRGNSALGSGGVQLNSCSPTPQTFLVQVVPIVGLTGSSTFHGGPAIVTAGGGICDFNFPQTCFSGSTPWLAVKL